MQVEVMLDRLRGMVTEIDVIVDLSVGKTFSERNQGFTHCLVVRLKDTESLPVYSAHPAHQALLPGLFEVFDRESIVVMDSKTDRVTAAAPAGGK